jgi:hypothetical protein
MCHASLAQFFFAWFNVTLKKRDIEHGNSHLVTFLQRNIERNSLTTTDNLTTHQSSPNTFCSKICGFNQFFFTASNVQICLQKNNEKNLTPIL